MLRRWILIISLPLLILAICLLQSYRFEKVAPEATVGMTEFKTAVSELHAGAVWDKGENGSILRLMAGPSTRKAPISFRIPVSAPVAAIHVRADISSKNLLRGKQEWDDGRVLLRWHLESDNEPVEIDPLVSVRDNERKDRISLVTEPSFGAGYPVLIIENLASSGEMTISGLELTPVRHRSSWYWMRWILAAIWFFWLVVLLSGFPKIPFPRRAAAAVLWLVMGILFAFPGPWKRLSPMLLPYELGGRAELHHEGGDGKAVVPETKTPQGIVSHGAYGKIPDQSGWIIQVRHYLRKQRLLLHFVFVVGITVVFTCLVGSRRATCLAAGLIIAMEGAQTGFGYGFDSEDIIDLVCGVVGIMLGRVMFGILCQWNFFSRWMALPPAELATPSVSDRAPDKREA